MPELAEVETLALQLHDARSGALLQGSEIFFPGWLTEGDLAFLEGLEIEQVERWGKRLRFAFSGGPQLISGLGMTGAWLLERPDKHLVARLETSLGPLFYADPRRFGHAQVFESAAAAKDRLGGRIGKDAASTMSAQEMQEALKASRMKLKAALLDQSRLSGIGNYLADEICFSARISPQRPLADITSSEWERLNLARQEVIARALKGQGASFSDYRHADGSLGEMQNMMMVYGKPGEPCPECGEEIAKVEVAGRSTHFCPACQA